jgi:uncharacterized protein (TIGR03083 family)
MEPARHLEILRAEGDLVASLPPEHLGSTVPTLPDWTVERVVRHLVKLHHWVRGALALPEGGSIGDVDVPSPPKGPDCLPAYRESLDELLAHLATRDPSEPAITFAGTDTVGWWMRRQAQELSVHRVDAHDAIAAAGGPEPAPLAVDGAADGIDEWASFFLAVRFGQRFGDLPPVLEGRSVHIHGTDDPAPPDGAEWLLRFDEGAVAVERTHAKGDVALRGTATDLLLALWRRRPLDVLDVIGDRQVAEDLLDAARF